MLRVWFVPLKSCMSQWPEGNLSTGGLPYLVSQYLRTPAAHWAYCSVFLSLEQPIPKR